MKFIKPFKGATGDNPYPQDFKLGDECPDDLVQAAIEAGVAEITLNPEKPDEKQEQSDSGNDVANNDEKQAKGKNKK